MPQSRGEYERLQSEFKAKKTALHVFILGLILYGLLTTLFTAIRSEAFSSDFIEFFTSLWFFIKTCYNGLLTGVDFIGRVGKHIPQPIFAEIVYWILAGAVFLAVCVGVIFIFYKGIKYLYEHIEGDMITLSEILISLEFIVFFADMIKSLIPINLLLLFIVIFLIYVGIRAYVKVCRQNRYY